MLKNVKKIPWRYLGLAVFALLLHSVDCFAQKTLPLDNSTCNPQNAVNCLWNDHNGCFIRSSRFIVNATCAPLDASGRAGVQVVSPDGTQTTTTRCSKSVNVNDLCDTILSPLPPFETVTVTMNTPNVCDPPPPPTDFTADQDAPPTTCDPIVIDVSGQGFHLTSAADGVVFDFFATGHPIRIPWISPPSGNAFLVLDRNHNGKIDDATELFSNLTIQTKSPTPNGFTALAEFDKPENGGNGDGIIDEKDAVFSHLLLWVDENHDGVSQPNELHSLPELGVFSLGLKLKESRRTDEFGNVFRFRAKVNPHDKDDESSVGAMAYDVFLVSK